MPDTDTSTDEDTDGVGAVTDGGSETVYVSITVTQNGDVKLVPVKDTLGE